MVVQIYQLSDHILFKNATLNKLWKSNLNVLGNSLLRKDSLTLGPTSHQTILLKRHGQTRFAALMAAFDNLRNNS